MRLGVRLWLAGLVMVGTRLLYLAWQAASPAPPRPLLDRPVDRSGHTSFHPGLVLAVCTVLTSD